MTCFDVYINDVHVCRAGIEGFGVLCAVLTRAQRHPSQKPDEVPEGLFSAEELTFDVSGTRFIDNRADSRLTWISETLNVGDRIRIDVIECTTCSTPAA